MSGRIGRPKAHRKNWSGRRRGPSGPSSTSFDGTPGLKLAAPLRAFPYSWAGGATLANWSGLRWGTDAQRERRRRGPRHVLSGCIVLCDEAHHILHPTGPNRTVTDLTEECGERLWYAEDSVVVLFTATPVTQGFRDALEIMRLTQGGAAVDAGSNREGYVIERRRQRTVVARPHRGS